MPNCSTANKRGNETDDIWDWSDDRIVALGTEELEKIGILESGTVLDSTVIRMPKAYPTYFGSYDRFDELREYISAFENLYLIGRNGLHRYNNQDHSMLTAMVAVDNIINGVSDKRNIWELNTESEYHESSQTAEQAATTQSAAQRTAG